jgi:hypothetical protein
MTEYDRIVSELRDKHMKQASEYIPKAYQALIAEGLSPMDARDRIEKDIGDIFSKSTIRRHMPEEAKHKEKAREQPKKQLITTSGQVIQEPEQSDKLTESTFTPKPTNIFDADTAQINIGPQTVVLDPNPLWRAAILQRMNQLAPIYLEIQDGKVTKVKISQ